mmetsp:Transcript_5801/g.24431  ORF Transcript_5801/g.24431 Transcript_5801/m.24431 type:complete len:127 (+) Transcript_5801:2096-2476(+)
MREMKKGDFAFFYHSNCKPAGIVGLVTVVKEGYPDHTQFDEKSLYYDAKSTPEDPRWFMVDVKLVRHLKRLISLDELKPFKQDKLKSMMLLNNTRLSVQRVSTQEWEFILALEDQEVPEKNPAQKQ